MSSINNVYKLIATISLALGLTATNLYAAESSAYKHELGAVSANLTLNDGEKWVTDEALRGGMWKIRTVMEASLPEIHEGKFSNAKYGELAKKVGDEVSGAVANCKLESKTDAQLHLIIADIMGGVEVMEGKVKKVKRQVGVVKVLNGLDKYAAYFDHPDWKPIKH